MFRQSNSKCENSQVRFNQSLCVELMPFLAREHSLLLAGLVPSARHIRTAGVRTADSTDSNMWHVSPSRGGNGEANRECCAHRTPGVAVSPYSEIIATVEFFDCSVLYTARRGEPGTETSAWRQLHCSLTRFWLSWSQRSTQSQHP